MYHVPYFTVNNSQIITDNGIKMSNVLSDVCQGLERHFRDEVGREKLVFGGQHAFEGLSYGCFCYSCYVADLCGGGEGYKTSNRSFKTSGY